MRKASACLLLAAGLAVSAPVPADAADEDYLFERESKPVALLIGNGDYHELTRLPGAHSDIAAVRATLLRLGFSDNTIFTYPDIKTRDEFELNILPEVAAKLNRGGLLILYYSGHGFSFGSETYLAPTSLPKQLDVDQAARLAIPVSDTLSYLERKGAGVTLALLDACRTPPDIDAKQGGQTIPVKGHTRPPDRLDLSAMYFPENIILGYATRGGFAALGAIDTGKMSPFTAKLVTEMRQENRTFDDVFADASARTNIATNGAQLPHLHRITSAYVHLNQGQDIRKRYREAWQIALDSKKYEDIKFFSLRYALSQHAAAAQKWLADYAAKPLAFSATGYVASDIDRAWQESGGTQPSSLQSFDQRFALPRVQDFNLTRHIESGAISDLGTMTSGRVSSHVRGPASVPLPGWTNPSATPPVFPASNSAAPSAMLEQIYAGSLLKVYAAPRLDSAMRNVPRWASLRISGIETVDGKAWYRLQELSRPKDLFYLPVEPEPSQQTLMLGYSLKEIILERRPNDLEELVNPAALQAALNELKAAKRTVTWVSLAVEQTNDRLQRSIRSARLNNAVYLLTRRNIDRKNITAIENSPDKIGDGVRVRIFGF